MFFFEHSTGGPTFLYLKVTHGHKYYREWNYVIKKKEKLYKVFTDWTRESGLVLIGGRHTRQC